MERDIFNKVKTKGTKALFLIVIVILIILFVALNSFVIIGAGERGVVLNFGAVQPEVLNEGPHFIIPLVQKVVKMDVKIQKSQTDADASSRDLQEVSSAIALNYHIIPDKSNVIYQKIGVYFKDRIIDPAVQEVVKAVAANYAAEELITKRPGVSRSMQESLAERLLGHNIAVDGFSIVNFSFSKLFKEAIEAKQTAEQLALKAKRDLDRVKIEAQQKITKAKAEAEALRLQKENISSQLIGLRRVEASMKAIEKWNGVLPSVTSGAVPFIDVKSFE